jgi:putative oxidoreductase
MLAKMLAKGTAWAALPLRLALAAVFIAHGGQKLFGLFGGQGLHTTAENFEKMGLRPGLLWAALASGAEFFGGVCLALGFLTRYAALAIVVTMTVAVVKVHWAGGFFLTNHGFEYPFSLGCAALTLVLLGPGKLSLDRALKMDS